MAEAEYARRRKGRVPCLLGSQAGCWGTASMGHGGRAEGPGGGRSRRATQAPVRTSALILRERASCGRVLSKEVT